MFPVINVRKNPDGTWTLYKRTDSIQVPSFSPYMVRLTEVPDDGTISGEALSITGLDVTTTNYPPSPNQVYVNYLSGQLTFDSSKAGFIYNVQYYGKGSLILADHVNTLDEEKVGYAGDTTGGDIAIWIDSENITSTDVIDCGSY